jgi:IclR family acetate operon transcriptional repressor
VESSIVDDVAKAIGPAPRYPIESVDNALRVLSLFSVHEVLRVKDVALYLGVATGTAHRLLAMLVYRGYLTQDPVTKLYKPGVVLLEIGLQASQRSSLRVAAGPHLDALKRELDETIHLATLEGTDVLYIDGRESSKTLRVASRAGTLRPAHCTSVGKALLSELGHEHLLRLYPDEALPQETPRSISSRRQLLIGLGDIRSRGYALNFSELEEGIGSVAVAVRDAHGRSVAALGAGAPMARMDDRRIAAIARAVTHHAGELSAEFAAG